MEAQDFPAKLNQIYELYQLDKISEAMDQLNKLQVDLESYPILVQLTQDYHRIQTVYNMFNDTEDWVVENSTGPVRILYKKVPDTPTYSILCESTLPIPLFNFLSLIYETDSYPTWMPFCVDSEVLQSISRSRKVVRISSSVGPYKREVCMEGYGANLLLKEGAVMIVCKSLEDSKADQLYHTKKTRAEVTMFGCLIRPIGKDSISVKVISNFDPKIKFLPYKLLNFFMRKLAKTIFNKITEKAANLDPGKFQNPLNRDFYNHINESLKEFFDRHKI